MNKTLSKYLFYYPATLLRGEFVWKHIRAYEQMQWKSHEEILKYQATQLKKLLLHANKTVPYYHSLFKDNNISVNNIKNLDQLSQLPIITKADIVKHSKNLHSKKNFYLPSNKTTGGSTGQAVTIKKNANALARERAATWRAYNWAGIGIGDIQARFWGTPLSSKGKLLSKAVDYISNRTRLSAFNINSCSLENYYQELTKLKPTYLYGYVSMILEFANSITKKGYPTFDSLKCVITTSEVLNKDSRRTIETALNIKVFNEYGCGEVGSIAHECEHGSMHIMAENVIIEIDTSNSPDEKSGKIIVTDLHNYAMPLIRYDVGDYATLSSQTCPCGRGLPIIEKIHGRAYDIIMDIDGNKYHPEVLMYIFENLKTNNAGISQFQVIQKDASLLKINLIKGPNYHNDTEKLITERIHLDIHQDFHIDFNYVNKINREDSGKLRIIKSEIQHKTP